MYVCVSIYHYRSIDLSMYIYMYIYIYIHMAALRIVGGSNIVCGPASGGETGRGSEVLDLSMYLYIYIDISISLFTYIYHVRTFGLFLTPAPPKGVTPG